MESLKEEVVVTDDMKEEAEAKVKRKYQECFRQCMTLLKQILAHRWAWPFAQPVNVEALGLEVIGHGDDGLRIPAAWRRKRERERGEKRIRVS